MFGLRRRVDDQHVCATCQRVMVPFDRVRDVCRSCGVLEENDRRLRDFWHADHQPTEGDPLGAEYRQVCDIIRRSHVVRPGPGQGELF